VYGLVMKIHCTHCDQRIEADDSLAGKTVDCPACSKPFKAVPVIEHEPPQSPATWEVENAKLMSNYGEGERAIHITLAVIVILFGLTVLLGAKSAIHEILAGICLLIAAVLFSGCAVAKSVHLLRKDLEKRSLDSE